MADYSNSKTTQGAVYPNNVTESPWHRLEPLLTPEKLRMRFLFGLPLISAIKDPVTCKPQAMTDDVLKDFIIEAVGEAELESGIDIFPNKVEEKQPFDRAQYESFGYLVLRRRPVHSIEALTVRPSNNIDIYTVPLEWIETAYLVRGQLNVIPLGVAMTQAGGIISSSTAGGSIFLSILGYRPWIAAFWNVSYTSGFKDGQLPQIVNQYIGCIAAMNILSALASTYSRSNSASLSIDGMSQSASGPGPQLFKIRYDELLERRKNLLSKIKKMCGLGFFSDNV